jgi:hypothetical protein
VGHKNLNLSEVLTSVGAIDVMFSSMDKWYQPTWGKRKSVNKNTQCIFNKAIALKNPPLFANLNSWRYFISS